MSRVKTVPFVIYHVCVCGYVICYGECSVSKMDSQILIINVPLAIVVLLQLHNNANNSYNNNDIRDYKGCYLYANWSLLHECGILQQVLLTNTSQLQHIYIFKIMYRIYCNTIRIIIPIDILFPPLNQLFRIIRSVCL
jgi:hypothetical protein